MKPITIASTVLLVFAALALHLSVSWQDFSTLARNGYLYDDSFYAFQIARNIADGQGVTFDGETPTNGFQPLYVFMLVPIYKVFAPDRIAPIYAALTLLALLTVATSVLLFLIARRYVNDAVALFAAMVWVVSPVVVRQSSNGLETALALFLFAFSIYYYLEKIRSNPNPRRGQFFKLGLLLGLAILSREDEFLLALAMALDYLLLLRKKVGRGESRAALRGVGITVATAMLVFLPWAVYGIAVVGSPFQESGGATRFLSLAYAPFFDIGPAGLADDGAGPSFIWAHIAHSLSVLKISPPVHAMYRALEKATGGGTPTGLFLVVVNVLSLIALAGFTVWLIRTMRSGDDRKRGEMGFLLLFAVLLMAAYATYVFGVFFFTRYLYPVYFIATIFSACLLQDVIRWVARKPLVLRTAVVASFGLYAAALVYMGLICGFRSTPVYRFYDIARWVEQNTAEHETIGVFQGGAIGYFSNRRVINLDGKVNGHALAALKRGDIGGYIVEEGIDVVMDHANVLELFLDPCEDTNLAGIEATKCFNGKSVGANGWVGFRLSSSESRTGSYLTSPTESPATSEEIDLRDSHLSD